MPSVSSGHPFTRRFLTPIYLGSALNPVNSSMLATALVPIAAAVDVSVGRTAVLVTALYLTSAIAQPTCGKLAEEFGPRRVFLAGIALVFAGGVVGGLGQNLTGLVVARVLIGAGTSAGYPSAMLLIRRRAEAAGLSAPPGGVLGGIQVSAMVTATVGLPVGGLLVGTLGWRSTFLINVPVALLAFVMAVRWIQRDAPVQGSRRLRDLASRIDVPGIVGFGAAMVALLVFLFSLPEPNWIALGLAVVLFAALIGWELRARRPFIDIRLLASNLALSRTYVRFALTTLCLYTVLYGVTQWLQATRGFGAETAGLLIVPMSALSAVLSLPIARHNLLRGPLIAAAVSALVGSLGVLFLTSGSPLAVIVAITLMFGATMATTSVGNQAALYAAVDSGQIGTASGLLRTFAYIGSVGSSALIAVSFHREVTDQGLHTIAVIMIAVSVLALVLTVADRSVRKHRSAIHTDKGEVRA
jgi:MFS family permease